jgi:hypothetical protein
MPWAVLIVAIALLLAIGDALYLVYRESAPDLPPRENTHPHRPTVRKPHSIPKKRIRGFRRNYKI